MLPVVLLAIGLLVTRSHGSSYPTEVVELTDPNFEHDTQAASGQTTGVWAVLFTDSTLKRHERAALVFQELAQDEEKELIYAQVDVARSIKLARRFGDIVLPPCVLLFRDRQVYVYDQSFDRDDIVQQIRDFVTEGYAAATPLEVPAHHERTLDLEAMQRDTKPDLRVVFVAILMIVGGLLFQTWAILNKDKFKPEPGTAERQQQPAAAAAAPGGKAGAVAATPTKGKAKAS